MHEQVREFLENNRREDEKAGAEAWEETLIRLGLWEKECAPEDKAYSPAYPEKDGERQYRKAPVPVSEEDWTEIRKYAKRSRVNKIEIAL